MNTDYKNNKLLELNAYLDRSQTSYWLKFGLDRIRFDIVSLPGGKRSDLEMRIGCCHFSKAWRRPAPTFGQRQGHVQKESWPAERTSFTNKTKSIGKQFAKNAPE